MESRKIQIVGNRSYSVSLPKKWVGSNNLKDHDIVFIDITDNNDVLIRKTDIKNKLNKNISVNLENFSDISEFLVFCYPHQIYFYRLENF